jgi:hypothetical protein
MEPRLGADFGGVRIHTDEKSAKLNQQVSAKAFTVGSHVFFGKGAYQPDTQSGKELIAHELTHTIQQGAAPQKDAVQRRELPEVTRQSPRAVQRLGISDALDYIADKANVIPGFRMFTILLGVNPINMSPVARTAANVLRAVIEFLPGGGLMTQALENSGIFDKVGGWVDQQLKTLGMVGGSIKQALMTFLDSLSRDPHADREARGDHAGVGFVDRGSRQEPDHRRAGSANGGDADSGLPETDRSAGSVGERQEGERDSAVVGVVPRCTERIDGVRHADSDAVHQRPQVP